MRKIAIIALVAATPFAASAQSVGLTGLQNKAARILVSEGFDVDVRSLSANQVVQIIAADRADRRSGGFNGRNAIRATLSR